MSYLCQYQHQLGPSQAPPSYCSFLYSSSHIRLFYSQFVKMEQHGENLLARRSQLYEGKQQKGQEYACLLANIQVKYKASTINKTYVFPRKHPFDDPPGQQQLVDLSEQNLVAEEPRLNKPKIKLTRVRKHTQNRTRTEYSQPYPVAGQLAESTSTHVLKPINSQNRMLTKNEERIKEKRSKTRSKEAIYKSLQVPDGKLRLSISQAALKARNMNIPVGGRENSGNCSQVGSHSFKKVGFSRIG